MAKQNLFLQMEQEFPSIFWTRQRKITKLQKKYEKAKQEKRLGLINLKENERWREIFFIEWLKQKI